MPELPGMGGNEKDKAVVFTTPSYDIDHGQRQSATLISHQNLPTVGPIDKTVLTFTFKIDSRDYASFRAYSAVSKTDFAFLFASALATLVKALNWIHGIFHRGKGKDESCEDEGKLIVKDSRSGKSYDVPIRKGSVDAMQFRKMSASSNISTILGKPLQGGLKVLDIGYQNTACAVSSITYVDGENGRILFRGHNITDLHREHCFDEVAYLLIWGELPRGCQLARFRAEFAKLAKPPHIVIDTINAFPRNTPAYLMLITGLAAWAAALPELIPVHVGETLYMSDPRMVDVSVKQCFASFATTIALIYCHQQGYAFTPAEEDRTVAENVLVMMNFVDKLTEKPQSDMAEVLDKLWILYADHEMTASTAAFLHTGSVGADALTSCISSVATAWGPLHAGAIDLVFKKLEEIGSVANVEAFIEKVRNKEQRLMGVGHRLYKTQDPRGKLLRERLLQISLTTKISPLLAVALKIERVVNVDPYFTSRKLCMNADLYGGLVFTALGFDRGIITCMASLGRCAGGLAHWREAANKPPKIWRPTQVYTGLMSPGEAEVD